MASGAFPVDMVHEDGLVFAIRDIAPRAPTHLLVIPRQHIPTAHHLTDGEAPLLGHMFSVAAKLMDEMELSQRGYRLAFNVGAEAGQTVYHLHMHVLAGGQLGAEA
jgi:diadenosine tetraphosphate (Ap4A) HIT family hydrolase